MFDDLEKDIRNNPNKFKARILAERSLYLMGEECGWDRETIIVFCLKERTGWLGREVFETSFDDGSMKQMATLYHRVGLEVGV